MPESPEGLLLLDKPSGVTSFDCVAVVRRRSGVKRVGHCGTLDPAARGLMLILIGSATRQQDSFMTCEKEYWFRGEFGRKTATADLEGRVIEERPWDHVSQEQLESVFRDFIGVIKQLPPAYSALKYKGKPYYSYARKGIDIPRAAREITIHSLSLLSFQPPFWEGRVVCSRGTYVRTLIEDVAERLGTCATLVELVRERIGSYRQQDARSLQDVNQMDVAQITALLRPPYPTGVSTHA